MDLSLTRGGVVAVFGKKFFEANNQYVAEHNYNAYNTYGVPLGANNLNEAIIEKFPLSLNSFETVQEDNLQRYSATANDLEYDIILEVDLYYPD